MYDAAAVNPPAESGNDGGNEWLNLKDAARALGYSTPKPVRAAIERGELRAYKAPDGRGLRVRAVDLQRYVESCLLYEPQVRVEAPAPTPAITATGTRSWFQSASPSLDAILKRRF